MAKPACLGQLIWASMLLFTLSRRILHVSSQPQPICYSRYDAIFALDGSDSMMQTDLDLQKAFVIRVIERIHMTPTHPGNGIGVVVGTLVFSTTIVANELVPYNNKPRIIAQTRALPFPREGTHTEAAIARIRQLFGSQGRPGVPYIGVIITDGFSKNPVETLREARLARQQGITLLAVGVGRMVDRRELRGIASNPQLVFEVPNFQSLSALDVPVTAVFCPELAQVTNSPAPFFPPVILPPEPQFNPNPNRPIRPVVAVDNPCDNCTFLNGVGYNPHPTNCHLFYQCELGGLDGLRAHLQDCGPDLYWNANVTQCLPQQDTYCANDMCIRGGNIPGLNHRTALYQSSCVAYSLCDGQVSAGAACCNPGQRYTTQRGCVIDATCTDPCPVIIQATTQVPIVCDEQADPANVNNYQVRPPGWTTWITMPCAPGTQFDIIQCGCVHAATVYVPPVQVCKEELFAPLINDFKDYGGYNYSISQQNVHIERDPVTGQMAARFDGRGIVRFDRFSNYDYRDKVLIQLEYRETAAPAQPAAQRVRFEAIIANSDCRTLPSLSLAYDRVRGGTYGEVETWSSGRRNTEVINTVGGQNRFKKAELLFNGQELRVTVDGVVQRQQASGYIRLVPTALKLGGACDTYEGFHGYIRQVRIFICLP